MKYYEVCVIGMLCEELIYHSEQNYENLSEVSITLKNKTKRGVILKQCQKPAFKTIAIQGYKGRFFTQLQYDMARFISEYYGCYLSMVFELFEPKIDEEFLINTTDETLESNQNKKTSLQSKTLAYDLDIKLNSSQKQAYDFLNSHNPALLFGDTGSGKSEIYFKLIEKTLNEGGQVLFLMPEIALTVGMQKRVKKHFKDDFITWHSKLTKQTKAKSINKLLNGDANLVLGARSALFLPYNNLRLIIVDEEHDNSYKSSSTPLYNAKDIALYLAKKHDIKVVLGSATPSLNSYYRYEKFRLSGTYFNTQKTYIYDNSEYGLSDVVLSQIHQSLEKSKQVMVFLPTRANFRQLECKICGKRVLCPFCEIALSVHLKQNILKCHYCSYAMPIVNLCPSCDGDMLEAKKIGTAEVLKTLQNVFSDYNVAKLDSDEITSKSKLDKILDDFGSHKIDILVGTQMISKGHDYLNVDLAVILGLDEYLFYPNYLAKEQTLSLCKQIAGRAGRSGQSRVLIQTHNQAFFQKYIDDYELFLQDELKQREDYPPFSKLLYIVISHKKEEKSYQLMQEILSQIVKLKDKIYIAGYGKSGIYYINSHFRHQILIKSKYHKVLSSIAKYANSFDGVKADIDPINFI